MPARAKFMRRYFSLPLPPPPRLSLSSSHTRQVRAGKAWTGCCICMHRLIWMHRCILNGPRCYLIPFSFRLRKVSSSVVASIATLHARKRTARISNYRSFPRSLTLPLLSPARGVYERLANESFGNGVTIIVQQVRHSTLKERISVRVANTYLLRTITDHCAMCYNLKLFKEIIRLFDKQSIIIKVIF